MFESEVTGPEPAGQHDLLSHDALTVVGDHTDAAAVLDDEIIYPGALVELGTAHASTLHEGLGHVGGTNRSIFG